MPACLLEPEPSSVGSTDDESAPNKLKAVEEAPELPPADACRALVCLFMAMVAIGHCQYTWTLFVTSVAEALSATTAALQGGFSLFIICQTLSVLVVGLAFGGAHLRSAMQVGSVLVALGLGGLSIAATIQQLYASCAIMGIGVGAVYNGCVALCVVLFPARRGLVAGIVGAGYGCGSLFSIAPLQAMLAARGHAPTLRLLALAAGGGALVIVCALPRFGQPRRAHADGKANCSGGTEAGAEVREAGLPLRRAVREPSFWTLYVMIVIITSVGLVIVAQLSPMAEAHAVPASSLVLALQVDRVLNGVSRPAWGYLSDLLGRATALGLAFGLQALVLVAWAPLLSDPALFVLCSGLSTFSWGEVYSLFPALAADLYGTPHVSANYGALYTAKGVASIIAGPLTSWAVERASWESVLLVMAAASAFNAGIALCVLRRLMQRRGEGGPRWTELEEEQEGKGARLRGS